MEKNEKADMYCGFGAYNNESGNYEIAIDQFEKALKENPEMDIAWNNLGNAKKSLRQNEEALFCYQKAIECSPTRFEFHYHKALLLIELSRFEEAEKCMKEALNLNSENVDINFQLASIYKKLKQYENAIHYYKKCLDLSPENPDVLKNYIGSIYSSGKMLEAERILEKYAVFPTNDISWFLVIPTELMTQNKDQEIDHYFENLKNKHNTLYFKWMQGFFYHSLKQLDLAESIFRAVLEKEAENINCIYSLSQILCHQKKYEESLNLINKCIAIGGNQRAYYDLKLNIIQHCKTKEEVLKYVVEMEQLFTDDPLNIWFRYGLYLKSIKKEYIEAIKIFEKVNQIQENGWSHYQIGLSYNLLNEMDKCLTHLGKAFSMDRSTREDARFFHELDGIRNSKDFQRILTNFEKEEKK